MQIVPLRFCHIGTKKSVLWPSKYAKIRFRPGLCPGPAGGADDAPLGSLVSCGRDTPPMPHPTRHQPTFGARRASPEFQHVRLWVVVVAVLVTSTTLDKEIYS